MALASSRSIQIGSEKSLARDDASKQRRKMALALIFLYFGLEFSIMSGENGHYLMPLGNNGSLSLLLSRLRYCPPRVVYRHRRQAL